MVGCSQIPQLLWKVQCEYCVIDMNFVCTLCFPQIFGVCEEETVLSQVLVQYFGVLMKEK